MNGPGEIGQKRLELHMLMVDNDYQQLIRDDAAAAAIRAGFRLDVHSAENDYVRQKEQLNASIRAASRPLALLVSAVRDNALDRVARDAVATGIGWVLLNRSVEYLDDLRREFPGVLIAAVSPDQLEAGRIQGRQFRALLPKGGLVLYVQGPPTTSAAAQRLEGMRETIQGGSIEVAVVYGDWTAESGEKSVDRWLRFVMGSHVRIDLLGAQNDQMAMGARKALQAVAAEFKRPEIGRIPITGVDGLPGFGQRLVKEHVLTATVVMPSSGGPAVSVVSKALRGERTAKVVLAPQPYPSLAEVTAKAPRP